MYLAEKVLIEFIPHMIVCMRLTTGDELDIIRLNLENY